MSRLPRATKAEMRTRKRKRCGACRQMKPLKAFHRSSRHGDGYKTDCKLCRNARSQQNYEADTAGRRTKMQERYNRQRDIIKQAKDRPCEICQQRYPSFVMQFHHRNPKTKIAPVAKLVSYAEATLRREIAKCQVVCANCHAILTHGIKGEDAEWL